MLRENKKKVSILLLGLLLLVLTFSVSSDILYEGYVIDGDSVYWEVANNFKLTATPHTIQGDGCMELTLENLGAARTIDIAFRFEDDSILQPKHLLIYNPHEENITQFNNCNGSYGLIDFNTGWCNSTVMYENGSMYGEYYEHDFDSYQVVDGGVNFYWNELITDGWVDYTSNVQYSEYNGKDIYYLTNVNMAESQTRTAKACFDRNILSSGTEKFDIFMKLSSDTLQEAFEQNRYVMLDPWSDTLTTNGLEYSIWRFENDLTDELGNLDLSNLTVSLFNTTDVQDGTYSVQMASGGVAKTIPYTTAINLTNTDSFGLAVWASHVGEDAQGGDNDMMFQGRTVATDIVSIQKIAGGGTSVMLRNCGAQVFTNTTTLINGWNLYIYNFDNSSGLTVYQGNDIIGTLTCSSYTANLVGLYFGNINSVDNTRAWTGNLDRTILKKDNFTWDEITNLNDCGWLACGTAPNMSDLAINTTLIYDGTNVNFSAIYYDDDNDAGTVYFNVTVNEVHVDSSVKTTSGDGESVSVVFDNTLWTTRDNISFKVNAFDGTDLGTQAYLNYTVSNYVPNMSDLSINVTTVYNSTNINFSAIYYDGDGHSGNISFNLSVNDAYVDSSSTTVTGDGECVSWIVTNSNYVKPDNISIQVYASDSWNTSSTAYINKTVQNTAPNATDLQTNLTIVYSNSFINFSASYFDEDNDAGRLFFNLTVDDVYSAQNSFAVSGDGEQQSWIVDPANYSSGGELISLQVYAYDNTDESSFAYLNYTVIAQSPNSPTLQAPTANAKEQISGTTLIVNVSHPNSYKMNATFYYANGSLIGTNLSSVSSGSNISYTYNFNYSQTFDWYVNVTDGTNTANSSIFNFTITTKPSVSASITPITLSTTDSFSVIVNVSGNTLPIRTMEVNYLLPSGLIKNLTLTNTTGLWKGSITDLNLGGYSLKNVTLSLISENTNIQNITYTNLISFERTSTIGGVTGGGGGGASVPEYKVVDNETVGLLSFREIFLPPSSPIIFRTTFITEKNISYCFSDSMGCAFEDNLIQVSKELYVGDDFISSEENIILVTFEDESQMKYILTVNKINLGFGIGNPFVFRVKNTSIWGYFFTFDDNNYAIGIRIWWIGTFVIGIIVYALLRKRIGIKKIKKSKINTKLIQKVKKDLGLK